MKQVFKIARTEIRYLLYSPLSWVGMFILFLFFAYDYINVLSHYVGIQDKGGIHIAELSQLTSTITLFCPGLAWFVRLLLMHSKFAVPFVMMGIISREYTAGTIRLIYSSPIRISTFIWGKFLGCIYYCMLICSLFLVLVLALNFSLGQPDTALLLWQLTATFIYYVFIASVCLFSSSLSAYSIVGGIISIVILLVLSVVNGMGQQSFLADFLYPLSHQAAIHRLIGGGIDLNDLVFLLVLTLLFVALTIVKMQNTSRNYNTLMKSLRYASCVVGALIILGMLPYTPLKLIDVTNGNKSELPVKMQTMLKAMNKGPLEVTHYVNIIFPNDDRIPFYIPEGRAMTRYETWRKYLPYKQDIRIQYKYYYAADTSDFQIAEMIQAYKGLPLEKIAAIMADTYGFDMDQLHSLEDIKKEVDLPDEEYNGHLIRLKYQGRETIVRTMGPQFPKDANFYPAFERLVSGRGKETLIVRDGKTKELYYKTGASIFTTSKRQTGSSWMNTGPLMDSIWLSEKDVPPATRSLVLAGPRQPLSPVAINKIKQFIDAGGNMFIAGESQYKNCIAPVMDYLGVKMKSEVLVQPHPEGGSSKLQAFLSENGTGLLWQVDSLRRMYRRAHLDTLDIISDGAIALEVTPVNDFKVTPLVCSRKGKSWNRAQLGNYDSLAFRLPPLPDDEQGSFPIAVLLTRTVNGHAQKIIVSGDPDLLRPMWMHGVERSLNQEFIAGIQSVLTDNMFEVNLNKSMNEDNYLRITMAGVGVQRTLFLYIMPAGIALAGILLIFKRRRK